MALEKLRSLARSVAYNGRFTLHLSAKGCSDRQKIIAMAAAVGRVLGMAAPDGKAANKKIEIPSATYAVFNFVTLIQKSYY
jgi:imidazoleglycerol phosphate dehydratase HisB